MYLSIKKNKKKLRKMKPLDNPEIFKDLKGRIFSWEKDCSLYRDGDRKEFVGYYCSDFSLYSECALFCYYGVYQMADTLCNFRRVNQNFYSADYILSGCAYFRMGKQCFIAEPGDVALLHPHNDTEILYPGTESTRSYGFCFNGTLCPEVFRSLGLEHISCLTVKKKTEFEECCRRLLESVKEYRTQNGRIISSGRLYEFLQRLSLEKHYQVEEKFPRQIHQYLQNHFQEDISLAGLSRMFQVSQPTLKQVFFRAYHQNPLQYLRSLRLEHAAKMLVKSDCSIKEIALSSGFSSPQYFCAVFSSWYRCSPGEYRKMRSRTLLPGSPSRFPDLKGKN